MSYLREVAIICLTVIELMALYQGIDGVYLSLIVGAISGIAGYTIAKKV